jgi:transposase InsO family protein
MRKENLHCRLKKRWIHTTDSRHGYRIYPNLARETVAERPNELWVADITYVHLVSEVVYLAVILDAFSRRIIGWSLSRHIDTQLTLAALEMALATRTIEPGLIHHSDRGSQYASAEYVALLESKNIAISMSRKGNPYDNAKAESFIKTLKSEEVRITEYDNFAEANLNIAHFIDVVYNSSKRLHSALGYVPPEEFEAEFHKSLNLKRSILTADFTVSN